MSEGKETDIIVIGGGTIGSAVAWYLSRQRAGRVLLIEKNGIGSGAGSWAASLMNRVRTKSFQIPMVLETYRAIHDLELELGESLGGRAVGSLHLAASDHTLLALKALEELAAEYRIPSERVSQTRMRNMLPWLDSSLIRDALYMPGDMYLDAYVLASAFARMARNHGCEILQGGQVRRLVTEGGRITGVELGDEEVISASVVVVAAGAWSNLLMVPAGAALPMAPVRSIYWLTQQDPGRFPTDMPITFLPDAHIYSRPEAGALLFGIRDQESRNFLPAQLPDNYQGFSFISDDRQWDILIREGQAFSRFFPDFYHTGIAHCVAGVSTYTPDGLPVIGAVKIQGLYAASGCNGAGVAMAGGYGRLVAEMVTGQPGFVDASDFRPDRLDISDPYDPEFMARCSASRTRKQYGG